MSCRRPVEHRRSELRSPRPPIGPRGSKPCHVTAPANIDSGCAAAAFLSFRCVVGGREGPGGRVRHTAHHRTPPYTPDHIARETTSPAEIPECRCRFAHDVPSNIKSTTRSSCYLSLSPSLFLFLSRSIFLFSPFLPTGHSRERCARRASDRNGFRLRRLFESSGESRCNNSDPSFISRDEFSVHSWTQHGLGRFYSVYFMAYGP